MTYHQSDFLFSWLRQPPVPLKVSSCFKKIAIISWSDLIHFGLRNLGVVQAYYLGWDPEDLLGLSYLVLFI